MKLEGVEVMDLRFIDLDFDLFGILAVLNAGTVKVFEIAFCRKFLWNLIGAAGTAKFLDTVETVNPRFVACGSLGHHIPALLELSQTVWFCFKRGGILLGESLMCDFKRFSVADCLYDCREILFARRHLLENDAVPHIVAFVQQVVERERLHEPFSDFITFYIIAICNIIPKAPVALDFDAESVEDGTNVVVECPFRKVALPELI